MRPWNDWYHVNGNTHGTWLRGDPRGWRARHHREHVQGDYKDPPPTGTYDKVYARSGRLMIRPPVRLSCDAIHRACETIEASLCAHSIETLAVAVDDHHYHILTRFPDHRPRHWIGIAKKDSARALSKSGLVPPDGIWAVRSRCLPIRDRAHQLNVFRYILGHVSQGAAVWNFQDQ